MASILDLLFGGHQAAANTPPPQLGYMTPQLNGGGQPQGVPPAPPPYDPSRQAAPGSFVQSVAQQAPTGPLVSSATNPQAGPAPMQGSAPQAPQAPADPSAIGITGDNWHPKHAGVLGQIADYFLGTHFGKNTVRQNEEGALQNLTSDPIQAVKRMAQFDPQGAQALYNQVMREQHQGAMERHYSDVYENTAENQSMGVVRNMAMNVNDQNMAGTRAQVVKYMEAKNMPQALIDAIPGDNATADDWKTFAQGGIPAGRQAALTEAARNHTMTHQDRQDSLSERRDFHSNLIPILRQNAGTNAGRLDETITHNTADEGLAGERINNQPGQPVSVQSDQGHLGTINQNGKGAYYDVPDGTGKVHRFIRGGVTIQNGRKVQHWIPTGEVINNSGQ